MVLKKINFSLRLVDMYLLLGYTVYLLFHLVLNNILAKLLFYINKKTVFFNIFYAKQQQQQQQQQQQALLQVALQQQQVNPVAQPYFVFVQPDSAVGKMQVAMATEQQQNDVKSFQESQKLTRQLSSKTTTSENHSVMNKSQQSVMINPPAITVKSKAAPPPVQPKPVRKSVSELQLPTSPPVISNGVCKYLLKSHV